METVPPRALRRTITNPLTLAVCLLLTALSPLALVGALIVDLFAKGNWRTVRLTLVGLVYVACESVAMVALLVLWIASGFGVFVRSRPFFNAHVWFVRWWLRQIYRAATRLLGLRIEIEDSPSPRAGAVLVFPRHAGPGDSVLIAHTLMSGYRRCPRIVMKAALQWAPCIDIAGNRLATCFIRPADRNASRFIERIAALASGIGEYDAFVLFPEGGNFTQRRWADRIERLEARGFTRFADRARRMHHLLAPRPGGALAAIDAAPHADVVFAAHTGLEYLTSLGELWRKVPLQQPILARYWRIAPQDIPTDRDERIEWLYTWWGTIDEWIESHSARFMDAPIAAASPDAGPIIADPIIAPGEPISAPPEPA